MSLQEELKNLDEDVVTRVGEAFLMRLSSQEGEDFEVGRSLAKEYPVLAKILDIMEQHYAMVGQDSPEELDLALKGAAGGLAMLREIAETEVLPRDP